MVANWKSHKTLADARKWIDIFSTEYQPDPAVKIIVAPPSVFLAPLNHLIIKNGAKHITLAVQDLSPFPMGSYTGAVAAEMVRDMVGYALLGHSERRRYFHETDQEVANKVSEAASSHIKPLVCVDLPYARSQIAAINDADMDDLIIGYGPVEAIGIDTAYSIEKVQDAVAEIKALLPGKSILYGGSINGENAKGYINIPGVAGLMVGSASLDPHEFAQTHVALRHSTDATKAGGRP